MPCPSLTHILNLCDFLCSLLGVSYAELRYEVPSLGSKPDSMETTYSTPPPSGQPNANHTDLMHSNSSSMQGGMENPIELLVCWIPVGHVVVLHCTFICITFYLTIWRIKLCCNSSHCDIDSVSLCFRIHKK